MKDFWFKAINDFNHLSILEIAAVIMGTAQVLFAYANKRLNFLAGLVSSIIFVYLFIQGKLYAESALQLYYIIMSIYGWRAWTQAQANNNTLLPITFTIRKEWIITSIIAIGGGILIYLVLKNFTDTDVPLADAVVSSIAWSGTWLMTRRKAEYWLVLNVSNIISVPLFIYKNYYFTAAFTLFLIIIAFAGYLKWRKAVKKSYGKFS